MKRYRTRRNKIK